LPASCVNGNEIPQIKKREKGEHGQFTNWKGGKTKDPTARVADGQGRGKGGDLLTRCAQSATTATTTAITNQLQSQRPPRSPKSPTPIPSWVPDSSPRRSFTASLFGNAAKKATQPGEKQLQVHRKK